ncbi:hypothetical protein ACU61A_26220 [Pseudonocardia sichuanensis]
MELRLGWNLPRWSPTLIAWGPHDGYMPEGAARAYLRDLPETHLDEIVALTRVFLRPGAPGLTSYDACARRRAGSVV